MLTYPLLKIGKKTSNTSNPCDIFNMNETGLFFRTTEDKTFHQKGQECSGGKRTKMWLTISLCTNMVGDKETPLVIWKSLNPCCFKCVNKKTLPVEYHTNKEARMTSGIFETWLKKFNAWVVKVEKFCCSWIMLHHIQMFSFEMWNWSTFFWSIFGTTNSCIVVIGYLGSNKIKVNRTKNDHQSRILIVDADIDEEIFGLINLYNTDTEVEQIKIIYELDQLLSDFRLDSTKK